VERRSAATRRSIASHIAVPDGKLPAVMVASSVFGTGVKAFMRITIRKS
jgi:hypothetical protein